MVRWTLMAMSTGMNHIPKLPFYLFTHKNFHKLQISEKFQFEPWHNYKMKVSHKNTENIQVDALGSGFFFSSILLFFIPLDHWTVPFSIARNFPHFYFSSLPLEGLLWIPFLLLFSGSNCLVIYDNIYQKETTYSFSSYNFDL